MTIVVLITIEIVYIFGVLHKNNNSLNGQTVNSKKYLQKKRRISKVKHTYNHGQPEKGGKCKRMEERKQYKGYIHKRLTTTANNICYMNTR